MRLFVFYLALCVLLAASPAVAAERVTSKHGHVFAARQIEFQGRVREYHVAHPPVSPKQKPPQARPAMFILHGSGGTAGRIVQDTTLADRALAEGAVVVAPQGVDGRWRAWGEEGIDDIGFLHAIVEALSLRDGVDAGALLLTGHSAGAGMSWTFACRYPKHVRAIAPVALPLDARLVPVCRQPHPLGVLLIMGTEDALVPYAGGHVFGNKQMPKILSAEDSMAFVAAKNGCNKSPRMFQIPDRDTGDNSQIVLYDFTPCQSKAQVQLMKVIGGGHTWPGVESGWLGEMMLGNTNMDIDASLAIWQFFKASLTAR